MICTKNVTPTFCLSGGGPDLKGVDDGGCVLRLNAFMRHRVVETLRRFGAQRSAFVRVSREHTREFFLSG